MDFRTGFNKLGPQPILLQLVEIGWMKVFLTELEEEVMWSGPFRSKDFSSLDFFLLGSLYWKETV